MPLLTVGVHEGSTAQKRHPEHAEVPRRRQLVVGPVIGIIETWLAWNRDRGPIVARLQRWCAGHDSDRFDARQTPNLIHRRGGSRRGASQCRIGGSGVRREVD